MYLKRLEVYGFKSFADKTELQFSDGITAIVGPNGCGKSNVGDAIRWVLGEQSVKNLRGEKMENMIFDGTEKRKKLSFCEVTLVFDNQARDLPIDYSEVAITRRLYRSGESEYLINRASCRLKDVAELIMDTGIGKEGYSIVGQGRIDSLISSKAEERRGVFEEAAGIVKYKTKKVEAERRLERTCQNIDRLNDMLSELSGRVEPLREQSETAQKYLAMRDELRGLEVNFYLYQYDMAADKKAKLAESLAAIEGEYTEKSTLSSSMHELSDKSTEQLAEINTRLEELNNEVLDLTARIENGSGESRVFSERSQRIRDDIARLQGDITADEDMKRTMLEARGGNTLAVDKKAADIERMDGEAAKLEADLAQKDAALEAESAELETSKGEVVAALNRLSDVKANMGRCEAMRTGINARLKQIDLQATNALADKNNITDAVNAQKAASADIVAQHDALMSQRDDVRHQLDERREKLSAARNEQSALQQSLTNASSRLSMLKEMKEDYESFNNSVKSIMKARETNPRVNSAVLGVIAQLLRVPKEYELAVETALGGAIQNIVTPTEEDAALLIDFLKTGRLGRATFLPVSAIRGKGLNPAERASLKIRGCFGIASELVACDPEYREITEYLLGRTVICQDIDTCISVARINRHSFRLVTLSGDVINAGGSMSGGSQQSRLTSVLGRGREIEEAEALITTLKDKISAKDEAVKALYAARTGLEDKLGVLDASLHENEVLLARDNERMNKLLYDLKQNEQVISDLEQEKSEHLDTLKQIDIDIAGISGMQGSIEKGNEGAQEEIAARTAAYNNRRIEREHLANILTEKKVQLAEFRQELAAIRSNAERTERELAGIDARTLKKREQIQELTLKASQLDEESVSFGKQIDLLRESLSKADEEKTGLAAERDKLNGESRERERRRRDLEQDLLAAQDKRHRAELALQKVDADISLMEQRIWDEYELTYLSASELRQEDFKVTGVQTEINRRRREINDLGTVNVNAIQEYVETKERFENLTTQLADLQKAEVDLRHIIADLIKEMEVRFAEQFALINKNFSATFKEMFGGGKAELRLENSDDILSSGIDIVAQPPGKALQVISLLSGGEKALTAISILFAMLKLKPTPFCLLDEIDAALDDENVSKFSAYLRNFSEKTQFIVVTHKKGTMEEADSLYGVSMEERGVTRIISVRLSDINVEAV